MSVRQMQYMIALAKEGSLNRAAKRLNISQPALSSWLSGLERELGTTLAIRSSRQLVLTPSGKVYLNGCRRILQLQSQAVRAATGRLLPESIVMGGSPIRGARTFACIFSDFHRAYPGVPLDFISGRNSELQAQLMDGTITLSLFGATETSLPDLEFIKIADEELALMVPSSHRLFYDASGLTPESPLPAVDLRNLSDTPLVISKSETSYYSTVLKLLESAGLTQNVIFRSNIVPLLYDMVRNGCGAGLIPRAYFSPGDPVALYSLTPKLISYQGIALKRGHLLTEAEQYLIQLTMKNWGAPVYLRNCASYYMQKTMEKEDTYLWT